MHIRRGNKRMKKTFMMPTMEVIKIDNTDIVTLSSDDLIFEPTTIGDMTEDSITNVIK